MRIIKIEIQGSNQSKTLCPKGIKYEGRVIKVGTFNCHGCSCFDRIVVNDLSLPPSQATYYVKCNAYYATNSQ